MCVWVCVCGERKRDRERQRQRETERDRDREREEHTVIEKALMKDWRRQIWRHHWTITVLAVGMKEETIWWNGPNWILSLLTTPGLKFTKRRKWTFKNSHDNIRNETGYILIKDRFRNWLKSSNHTQEGTVEMIIMRSIAKVQLKLKRLKKKHRARRLDFELLKKDPKVKEEYAWKWKTASKLWRGWKVLKLNGQCWKIA